MRPSSYTKIATGRVPATGLSTLRRAICKYLPVGPRSLDTLFLRMTHMKHNVAQLAAIGLTLLVAACGGGEPEPASATPEAAQQARATVQAAAAKSADLAPATVGNARKNPPPSDGDACTGSSIETNPSRPMILFVNGIRNDSLEACQSSEALASVLVSGGISNKAFDFQYFHNPNDGIFDAGDFVELRFQATLSAQAAIEANGQLSDAYYRILGRAYAGIASDCLARSDKTSVNCRVARTAVALKDKLVTLTTGRAAGVILVAHSQGNFYSEAAFSLLVADGKEDSISRIRFYGAAGVSASTPNWNWISSRFDVAIDLFDVHMIGTGHRRLPGNMVICQVEPMANGGGCPLGLVENGHGFKDVYIASNRYDAATGMTLSSIVVRTLGGYIAELAAIRAGGVGFSDTFNYQGTAPAFSGRYWNARTCADSLPSILEDGSAWLPACAYLDTQGKITVSGDNTVIVARVRGPAEGRDSVIVLVDEVSGDRIQIGDTTYQSRGLYSYGSGAYSHLATFGRSTSDYKYLKLELRGSRLTVKRASDLVATEDSRVVDLPNSAAGRRFYVLLSSGGSPDFAPAQFDSVQVLSVPSVGWVPGGGAARISVPASLEGGLAFVNPLAGGAICTVNAAGRWGEFIGDSQIPYLLYDANGIREDGYFNTYGSTPVPSAYSYSLIVLQSASWRLLGSAGSLRLAAGEEVRFMINDTPGYFYNNTGALALTIVCRAAS